MTPATLECDIKKTTSSRIKDVDFARLTFGETFSDHMLTIDYSGGKWQKPVIEPYGEVSMSPAAKIMHYGQGVFEGMKAFRYSDGRVNMFRFYEHYKRMRRSCERLQIPFVDEEAFIETLKKLIDLDRDWVPRDKFKSLYVRPFVFATDASLGMCASESYRYMVITSPVGDYYKEGIKPVSLTTTPEYVRAVKGGVGEAKTPGNYAASLYPGYKANAEGYTQVLWLDAIESRYVEEVGTMNIFFVMDGRLITPSLSGSILPGVTRKCVLELARKWDMQVEERQVSIDELFRSYNEGKLSEVFGSGTAAVVSPVGLIHHEGEEIKLDQDKMGPIAQQLYDTITQIHHGEQEDELGWCRVI